MDEQKPTTPVPGAGQVMDIAAPTQVIEPTVNQAPETAANPAVIQPASINSTIPVSEPAPSSPVASEPTPVSEPVSSSEPMHEPPASSNPTGAKPLEAAKPTPGAHAPHSGAPIAAIAIAIIVAAALAAVVIFSYMKARNSDNIKRTDTTSTQTVTDKPQASVADVDATDQELDSELEKANDDADFAATELDDSTLGL